MARKQADANARRIAADMLAAVNTAIANAIDVIPNRPKGFSDSIDNALLSIAESMGAAEDSVTELGRKARQAQRRKNPTLMENLERAIDDASSRLEGSGIPKEKVSNAIPDVLRQIALDKMYTDPGAKAGSTPAESKEEQAIAKETGARKVGSAALSLASSMDSESRSDLDPAKKRLDKLVRGMMLGAAGKSMESAVESGLIAYWEIKASGGDITATIGIAERYDVSSDVALSVAEKVRNRIALEEAERND